MQDLYASSIIVNGAPYEELVSDAVHWAWRGVDEPPAEAWSVVVPGGVMDQASQICVSTANFVSAALDTPHAS